MKWLNMNNPRCKPIAGLSLSIMILLITASCLNRQFITGKSELVSITDTLLNDSVIFVGYARRVELPASFKYNSDRLFCGLCC